MNVKLMMNMRRRGSSNRLLCWLWARAFSRWIDDGERVTHVLGWRTARIESQWKSIKCMTPCFWIFK